jgi:HTH-type transcriptional regulator / antitoxin HipB
MNLAELISQTRKAAGLTQQQLAELAAVGKTVVWDLENGKTTVRYETLVRVLRALNIRVTAKSPIGKEEVQLT